MRNYVVKVEYERTEATFLTRPPALLLLVCQSIQQTCSANLVTVDSNLAHSDSGDCLPVTSVPPEAMVCWYQRSGGHLLEAICFEGALVNRCAPFGII